MQSSPHSHVLPKPGLGRQGRKSSTHRCCTRSPQQAGASIRNITKASWRVSLLGSDYQINHFGGCGLPVLFFSRCPGCGGRPLCCGLWGRCPLPTPLYNRRPLFSPVARKKFLRWSAAPGGVAAPGWAWVVGCSAPGCPVRLLLTPSYNRFPVVFTDVLKKIFIHF